MEELWQTYKSTVWVEPFLVCSIILFILFSVILFVLILISRKKTLKQEEQEKEYAEHIEKMLFSVVFDDVTYKDVKADEVYAPLFTYPLFRRVLMRSVINLHQNYEGVYAKKLEKFYVDSHLIHDSFKRLKSRRWEVKCKGIKQLAEMNISKASPSLIKLSHSRNKTLKITAINACIKLNGTQGITHLVNHKDPIDNWTQLNIIDAFKKHDINDTEGIELLLFSKNSSVISLGLKIMQSLYLPEKANHIHELIGNAPNTLIQFEAQNVLKILTTPGNNSNDIF